VKAVVRTIEGDYAIIEMGMSRHKVIIPLQFLPPGVKEGITLRIDIRIDPDTPRKPRSKVTHIEQKFAEKRNRPG